MGPSHAVYIGGCVGFGVGPIWKALDELKIQLSLHGSQGMTIVNIIESC